MRCFTACTVPTSPFLQAKGACLIEFEKLSDAGEALDKMDGGEVDGVQVGVARLQEFESRRVMERREMATEGPARGGRRRSPIRADRGPLGSGGRGRRRFQSPGTFTSTWKTTAASELSLLRSID